ncbi:MULTISPECIES: hypothetical protein [Pseudomonas]|uniref:Uncharacterized protein n=1 Tax=Pseudomonas putida TaxID=303 RepID=A0A0P7DA61_PSEPU|nr:MULTISPECIES: hypothetical protein [Pseudomonas]KPM65322.1 hypothetical protein HB13667_12030 [Pseudomonas putida]MDM3874634.1 hypothetical protein [Pseudomonas asiatica]MDM9601145.1 hypothetical protein [Pseudomonas shirazica]MDO2414531.1 hypothetical protein [Pseudomonas shirazica]MDS9589929.1 hypothetical protein [Pseudomonas sp. HTZ1]
MPPRCSRYDPEIGQQLVAGLTQQNPEWIGSNLDGCLAHPGTPDDHRHRVATWRTVAGNKPYSSFIRLDLADNPDEPLQRWRFGFRGGRKALAAELRVLRTGAGLIDQCRRVQPGQCRRRGAGWCGDQPGPGLCGRADGRWRAGGHRLLLVWLGGRSKAAGKTAADAA